MVQDLDRWVVFFFLEVKEKFVKLKPKTNKINKYIYMFIINKREKNDGNVCKSDFVRKRRILFLSFFYPKSFILIV